MGIYDRDYMRDAPNNNGAEPIGKIFRIVLLAILLFFSLRFPIPVLVKLPLMVWLCFLIYRSVARW